MRTFLTVTASLSILLLTAAASAATITVGPSGTHAAPCAAIAAAAEGDTIEIDTTGTYTKDYCAVNKNNLTIRGVGAGRAKIDANLENLEMLPLGDAIWVVSADNITIEKVELTGAKNAITKKGAAVRQTGKGLTLTDCSIHDNDSGVVVENNPTGTVTITASEFAMNGIEGGEDDPGHISVGKVAKLTLTGSYLHHARQASMVISNAIENHVSYNRITSEAGGMSLFSLDFPLGGLTYVIGNIFHRSATDPNNKMVRYRSGQGALNPSHELFVVNNTFVSDETALGVDATIDPQTETLPVIRNNIFDIPGDAPAVLPAEAFDMASNIKGDALLLDKATYDYRLKEGSPAVDKGVAPGQGAGMDLTPVSQYMHTAQLEDRPVNGAIDIGAYEIPPPVNPSGAGGAGGAGGGAGVGGGGQGGEGEGQGGASASSTGTGGRVDPAAEGGCDCRMGTEGSPKGAALAALGVALLYGARRRRGR
jgi:MYXO-CTERM domain-containing protein